ncbi:MAG: hypothetical protein IPN86_15280 [Saprospiraceae bacterium]|nr:hypothetical protein [Saprospiraceae bacterium]
MKTSFLRFQWLFILVLGLFVVSCTDSSESVDDTTADAYAEEVILRTQESINLGKLGCYELVFPVTLVFPDGSTAEIDSYETLKSAIKTWRKENPRVRTRPSFAFPYDVITSEGEIITVVDEAQQKALRVACGKDNFGNLDPKGHHGKGKLCFKINFPFSVSLPDSTIVTLTSKDDRSLLHEAIKAYKEANPGVRVHPTLVFPIEVTMEDGTVVTVNSKEELKALKDSCN